MLAETRSRRQWGKVLLVNSNQMKPPVAPLALDYLAHALEQSHYQVDTLDLCFSTDIPRDIKEYFAHNEVLAVGFTMRNTDDTYLASQDFFIPKYKELIDLIKEQTDASIILGGTAFSIMPEAILSYCDLNLGIWGEGELSLPLLIGRIEANKDYRDVPCLAYRSQGEFHKNPAKYLDLSRFNTPTRSAVDNRRYLIEGGMGNIETKRGCPKKCIYCADPVAKGRKLRLRPPQSVADEIESLLEMGVDHLHFCDSEFNIPEDHAWKICLELVSRGIGDRLRWYTYASPAGFSQELAALCRRAGCVGINFGVDSGCDRMLRRLGRDFSVEDLGQTADACRREGIICMYDLLLGGPGESKQSLSETIETMKRISPDRVGATLGVRIFPGTKLAASVRKQGPLSENSNLHGTLAGNGHFFAPVFYLSSILGDDAHDYLSRLIAKDERFFFVSPADTERNYNYNENTVLVNAIREGYRGAFWDILRRLSE